MFNQFRMTIAENQPFDCTTFVNEEVDELRLFWAETLTLLILIMVTVSATFDIFSYAVIWIKKET